MVDFATRFGLPKDRKKLEKGLTNFEIFRIKLIKSKKKYDIKEEKEGKIIVDKKLIDIAYIDAYQCDDVGKPQKKEDILKFYASNKPIVEACHEMLIAYGINPDGTLIEDGALIESVHINEVKESEGEEKGKQPYLFFA